MLLLLDLEYCNKNYFKFLDLIINGEIIDAKWKHSFNFIASALVLLTGNQILFDEYSKNIIYLPFNTPKKKVYNLFKVNFFNNSILTNSFPGFINWILDNPKENLELFKDIEQLNNRINSFPNTNFLLDFSYFNKYLDINDNDLQLFNNLLI